MLRVGWELSTDEQDHFARITITPPPDESTAEVDKRGEGDSHGGTHLSVYLSPRMVVDNRVPGAHVTGCGGRAHHFRPDNTGPRATGDCEERTHSPRHPGSSRSAHSPRPHMPHHTRARPCRTSCACDGGSGNHWDYIPAEPKQMSPLVGGRPSRSSTVINPQLSLEVLVSVVGG